MPRTIGMVVSAKLATLHELQTVYSVSDLSVMVEIISIDNWNRQLANNPPKGLG